MLATTSRIAQLGRTSGPERSRPDSADRGDQNGGFSQTDSYSNTDLDSVAEFDKLGFDVSAAESGSRVRAGGSSRSMASSTANPRPSLLSVLKPDNIASARDGNRDPREQDQDTGEYTCSCPNNVYLFASVERLNRRGTRRCSTRASPIP